VTYPRQRSLWRSDGTRRQFYVYVLSNNSMTMYTGVTNDLRKRVADHRSGVGSTFTKHYHFDRLVFYEAYDLIIEAIAREKQIKGMSRAKKIALVKAMNPSWRDLSNPSS
jgi:putative endonuclease